MPDVDTDGPAVWGTVTITNDSASPVTLAAGAVTITGDAQFSIKSDGCSGSSLSTNQSCDIEYWFSPGASDPVGDYSADIEVAHSGLGSPLGIHVVGRLMPPV